ncbi:flagellar basal-body rod protein FlgG [Labrys wisconsinensis]|uniref:Flagellar basal-body rod protein FlgG n=1 Tax=Labrys wisconsinensis TaxID=425677 RepID=A0ABU0JAY1_9HYPH|nr:flagellar basal-body rod protein FlgG [Labrys wisconsinensis]MDQ0471432.1 flagellar basal-body rod protein FlgG [Labrys wisconsinensis]
MRALNTAATGMMAQELNVEVISNNIANMRTTGYKRQRAEFQDLLYETERRVGSTTSDQGTMVPAGIQIGSGVRTAATPRVMSQGDVTQTQKELDVAVRGEGYFRIQLPDGRTAYTRDGSFERDAQGQLVTADGYVVDPGITIPENASGITINPQGVVSGTLPGQTAPTEFGQLQLSRFVNKTGLEALGDNLFLETAASGQPQTGTAGIDGMGNLLQGYLEQANVNSVSEISDLIAAQRAYEMNSKVVSAADQMLQSATGMFR